MAISVHTIYNFFVSPYKLKLLAGKKGLNQSVSWVYYTEDPETIEFIRGGELAVTTGLNLERQKQNTGISAEEGLYSFLKNFIDSFISHNASGLIINIGKYINSIPQEIIDYCDSKDFPLFTMPWEVHTIDIMQDIGNMISAHNQNAHNIERFFYKAIFENSSFDGKQLENTPFFDSQNFTVALADLQNSYVNNDFEQTKRYVVFFFNPKMNIAQNDYCCFIHKQKIIYIIKNNPEEFLREYKKISEHDKLFSNLTLSVSDSSSDIYDLAMLYKHAEIASLLKKNDDHILFYDNLGIFKILVDIKNEKTLNGIYSETLGKLDVLDQDKKEDYLRTLKLYLKYGGNLQMVAEFNNIHRNTAIYRIQRLGELLQLDLSDGEVRCLLQTALYIKELKAS